MSSSLLVLHNSSTRLQYASVSFWISFSRLFLASFANASPYLSISFMTSLRTLRTAILASSLYLLTCFTRSLRLSVVSWGRPSLIFSPSFMGLMPKSDSLMARSMSLMALGSKGVIASVVLSGTVMLATCFKGVMAPKYSTEMRSKIAGLALPVRSVFMVSAITCTAFFMRFSASALASFSMASPSTSSTSLLPPLPPLPLEGAESESPPPPLPFLPLASMATEGRRCCASLSGLHTADGMLMHRDVLHCPQLTADAGMEGRAQTDARTLVLSDAMRDRRCMFGTDMNFLTNWILKC
mmetsp:Transcript_26547/g.68414  ORF Transcript_26547/g.68414 Transcript_26547/m.68414 type:complete len:297 (+) Transcript_26547:474-1364(+)